MIVLRHVLIPVLMVLMLPWGAFGSVAAPAGVTGVATDQAAGPDAAVAPGKRKCRSGVLPGSPCGPDLAVVPEGATSPASPADTLSPQHDDWRRAGQAQAPPTGPPRLS